ncbi:MULTISPECIES: DUF429 domain-containing protein [Pseudooceanicola]|nr:MULTISPECIES: DUF429 domain-containing protein [Pseudooceanicola]
MTAALPRGGRYLLGAPEPVGDTATLLARLRGAGPLLIGFDFPIGLPAAYGARTGFADFPTALAGFGTGDWADWFSVSREPGQISLHRPFYPHAPGGRKRDHLTAGLDLPGFEALLRLCDRKTPTRPAACALFWTLGGNQVGKAAITGWQEVLQPNLSRIGLWPFQGRLHDLLARHATVVAETYPAEAYGQIGITKSAQWSKRNQDHRRAHAAAPLLDWIARRGHDATPALRAQIRAGFSPGPEGEDQFDALAGLCAMLDVVQGHLPEGAPEQPDIRQWEGWILGQQP